MGSKEKTEIVSELRSLAQNLSAAVIRLEIFLNKYDSTTSSQNYQNQNVKKQSVIHTKSFNKTQPEMKPQQQKTQEVEEEPKILSHRLSLVKDIKKKFEFVDKKTPEEVEDKVSLISNEDFVTPEKFNVHVQSLKQKFELEKNKSENTDKLREEQKRRKSEEKRKSLDLYNYEDDKVKKVLKYLKPTN